MKHLLLLRHQLHASPLYTSRRTADHDPTAPRKTYGQAQANAQYGVRNRALQDPFTSMPTYTQRFVRQERALPDWTRRPVCSELFPNELLTVIEPGESTTAAAAAAMAGGAGPRKRRRLELTRVNALPNAEEAFGMTNGEYGDEDGEDFGDGDDTQRPPGSGRKSLLDRIDALGGGEEGEGEEVPEEEGQEEEDEQDMVYDDSDAGDYDAENYFDNGDEVGDDQGDDGDGEGTY